MRTVTYQGEEYEVLWEGEVRGRKRSKIRSLADGRELWVLSFLLKRPRRPQDDLLLDWVPEEEVKRFRALEQEYLAHRLGKAKMGAFRRALAKRLLPVFQGYVREAEQELDDAGWSSTDRDRLKWRAALYEAVSTLKQIVNLDKQAMTLRKRAIKLAYDNPGPVREALLPLLKEGAVAAPTADNIGAMASQFAAKAFQKGERWGGSQNRTTYPRKHYAELERMFGVLNARQLAWFNQVYDYNMAVLTTGKQFPMPKAPSRL